MPSDDLDFSLGGHPPSEYMNLVQSHTEDVLENVEKELSVEEEIRKQTQSIEETDQEIVEDLKEVLNIFSEYVEDMEIFVINVIQLHEDEGIEDSAQIMLKVGTKVGQGEINLTHDVNTVAESIHKVHNDLMDAFERLQNKDEKLSNIKTELEKIADEDMDLEKELQAIENMVDHMGNMAQVYEAVNSQVDDYDLSTS